MIERKGMSKRHDTMSFYCQDNLDPEGQTVAGLEENQAQEPMPAFVTILAK